MGGPHLQERHGERTYPAHSRPTDGASATITAMPKTSAKDTKKARPRVARVSDVLRLPPGPVDLSAVDTAATPAFDGSKSAGKKALQTLGPRLADLQERLYAEGRTGGTRSLLLVLQGMDTSGKGGTVRHVVGQVDPQGVSITAFKAPTKEEQAHDFLWRVKRAPAGARHARRLRPVALRGRRGRAGAQPGRAPDLEAALRHHQPVRGGAGRPGHHGRQVLPAHLQGRVPGPAARGAWTSRRSSGSSTPATSTAGRSGTR